MRYDLHTHTTASDGTLSPRQLIDEAVLAGLAGIAITDHDTTAALPDAIAYGRERGVLVIGGVEISTMYQDREVHVLGYGIQTSDDQFEAWLDMQRRSRDQRMHRMIEQLSEAGYPVSLGDVLDEAGDAVSLGRPHLARVIVRHGYALSVAEAFRLFLTPGRPGYVERAKLTPRDAVERIRACGGVPVLAHPGLIGDDSLLFDLIQNGLVGIEVEHPDHEALQRERYRAIAQSRGLLQTAGSDYHGASAGHRGDLGTCFVKDDVVDSLLAISRS